MSKEDFKTNKFTKDELKMLQNLPYEIKVQKSLIRIREWYENNQGCVAVSFSGGLDSTVLLHLVRSEYKDVQAVSIRNVECKENQVIIDKTENCVILKGDYTMPEINKKFGIPIGSKKVAKMIRRLQNPTERNKKSRELSLTGYTSEGHKCDTYKLPQKWHKLIDSPYNISEQCCYYMKEKPLMDYEKETKNRFMIATKATDSMTREKSYLATGCNTFEKGGKSRPLGFWTDQDILRYIVENKLEISKAYGEVLKDLNGKYYTTKAGRTGCFICLFGLHLEKQPNRMQRMEYENPAMYKYCMETLGYKDLLEFLDIPYRMDQVPDSALIDRFQICMDL